MFDTGGYLLGVDSPMAQAIPERDLGSSKSERRSESLRNRGLCFSYEVCTYNI